MTADDSAKPPQGLFPIAKDVSGFQIQVTPLSPEMARGFEDAPAPIRQLAQLLAQAGSHMVEGEDIVILNVLPPGIDPGTRLHEGLLSGRGAEAILAPSLVSCALPLAEAETLLQSLREAIHHLENVRDSRPDS